MIEQLAYLNDPLKLDFEAVIIQKTPVAGGGLEVILEQTYFYPTGGGQERDTGTLGQARVIDVFKNEAGQVVHRLDRDVSEGQIPATIDRERRLGHMQRHSAQHLLSRSFEDALGLETLAVKISADSPTTLDLPGVEISQVDLERVERLANAVILENRPIKSYVINDDQITSIPFRRPPKVTGTIRVVEIEAFDYSACGGTHCLQTGMIGLLKIIKTESKNQKLRVHFVVGQQALRYFQQYQTIVTDISHQFSTAPSEIVLLSQQQAEQLQTAQKTIHQLKAALLPVEAERLIAQAEAVDGYRLVLALLNDKSTVELRQLAALLRANKGTIAVLAGVEGHKLSLVVGCADDTGISARELLKQQLAVIGGRGGGNDQVAQGGGTVTAAQVVNFFEQTKVFINAGTE